MFIKKCDIENKELFVLGDLNCDWNKSPLDNHTQKLKSMCELYQLRQIIDEPTRVTKSSATQIDLILVNNLENISSFGVIEIGISDHSLIYAVKNLVPLKGQRICREVRNFKNFNVRLFLEDLSRIPWEIVNQFDDPNDSWQVWKSFFTEILDIHAPILRKYIKTKRIPWINASIKLLMRERDFHKMMFKKFNSETHWEKYRSIRNKISAEIKNLKADYFTTKISECLQHRNVKKSWSLINNLLGKNAKSTIINEIKTDSNVLTDKNLIANKLNDYFVNIGPSLALEVEEDHRTFAGETNVTDSECNTIFRFSDISVDQVLNNLKQLIVSKATGIDKIPAKVLKISADIVAPSLTSIFNQSLRSGIFVSDWKLARVHPIYKSEDRSKCENYRPISILPVVSKIFEKEIFRQLYDYLSVNSLISKFQSGFRPKYSTLTLLLQMCDKWLENMDEGKITGLISMDIKKAFDSINHQILMSKMKDQFGIHDNELIWFTSYLTDREQVCCVNDHISSRKPIKSGVPQGSILGPLMFLLYINDLPKYLKFTTPGLYADDTQIFASSDNYDELVDLLNSDLENISRWLSDNKLQHHATKTKLMFIGSRYNIQNKIGDKSVMFKNVPLIRYRSFKCLGVELDEHLTWEVHVNAICKKVGAGIGLLKRTKPFVPNETLHTIYKALIQPYFDYCSPLWDNCGVLLREKLQRFQNRAARVLTGANYDINSSQLLERLNWKNLETTFRFNKAVLVYNILNNGTAPCLREFFSARSDNHNDYNLRNYDTDLSIPKPKKEFLKRSFRYSGAVLWNSLSNEAKSAQSIYSFKRLI